MPRFVGPILAFAVLLGASLPAIPQTRDQCRELAAKFTQFTAVHDEMLKLFESVDTESKTWVSRMTYKDGRDALIAMIASRTKVIGVLQTHINDMQDFSYQLQLCSR
jgi:hypothetical protein